MNIVAITLYLVGLALGLAGAAFTVVSFRESRTKAIWPTANATVMLSGVSRVPTSNGGSFERYSVEFDYQVEDQPHQGTLYSDRARNFDALAAKYGDDVVFPVFYNPLKPAHCEVRDRLGKMGGWSWNLIAYLLYFAAGSMVFFGWVASSVPPA